MNHLFAGECYFPGCFTFVKGERKSQIDFLFTNDHSKITHFSFDDSVLNLSDHVILEFKLKMKLTLSSAAILKWAKDSRITGHVENKRMFKINFDVDMEKMKLVLEPKLKNYVNHLFNDEDSITTAVTQLNETLQE